VPVPGKNGEGVPPCPAGTWGGGYPPPGKKEGGGVGGHPPPPLVCIPALFLQNRTLRFAWNHDGKNRSGKVIIFGEGGSFRAGGGRGVIPCWVGTWGGGYHPRRKKRGGGVGVTPLPLCPVLAVVRPGFEDET
jgi:hypothetical protein